MDDNGQWLSVADAARKLGVTRQAIQGRIKRSTIEHRQDNRGNPLVRMPDGIAPAIPQATAVAAAATALPPDLRLTPAEAPGLIPLSVFEKTVEAIQRGANESLERQERHFQAEIARLRDDATQLHADHARERRVDRILTGLVAVLALAVIAILGPVVLR